MDPRSLRRSLRASVVPILVAVVSACGTSTEIQVPSTYVGDIASARMSELYLAESGGRQLGFDEVFETFDPQSGLLTDGLPFPKVAVADIVYAAARPVAGYYDSQANDNGYLEAPELLVLYIRESAIGLGFAVEYVGINPRVNALATSSGDVGALMTFVRDNASRMKTETQAVLRDLDRMGLDWRNRGRSGRGSAR